MNTGAQILFNGSVNPVDTAVAGVTGALTMGTGVLPGLLMNTGGSLTGSAIKRENPNTGMANAAVGTLLGYGAGNKVESVLGDRLNPWYRPEWIDIGNGISKYVPPSAIPSVSGTTAGAVMSEGTNAGVNGASIQLPEKK